MAKLIDLNSIKDIDYKKVGLICGLEIHQQLNTGKLFCNCPCEIVPNEQLTSKIERKFRFSTSEVGEIDKTAYLEFKKGKVFEYIYNNYCACLVDLDEEPPKGPNQDALETALRVGKILNLKFFDKIQFMRKIIINGSVCSGYQRTGMLGFGGSLETSAGKIKIEGVNLEEDACKIVEKRDDRTIFALDRQGIPLIEITTGPNLHNPQEAQEAALQIGNILRSFKETKRGLGTIRQDLNVSISGGARIEIKGAQNLKLIPEIIIGEIKRQMIMKSIIEELVSKKITATNFSDFKIYDVTKSFKNCTSKVILSNLDLKSKDSGVYAIKLFGFKGILGHEVAQDFRFATEVSERNKLQFPQIKGLFHGDELPKYGITQEEVDSVISALALSKQDNFILLAGNTKLITESLKHILEIIEELITKIPNDVRQVDPKGILTTFLRPIPGSARMYPETDIPEILVTKKYLDSLKVPELYEDKISRLKKELNIDESRVIEFIGRYDEDYIQKLLKISSKSASSLYSIIFDLPRDIKKRENIEPVEFKEKLLEDILRVSCEKELNSKIIRDIFISLYKDKKEEVEDLNEYLKRKNLLGVQVDESEIEKVLKEIVSKNSSAPMGALMGHAMKHFGGKVEGKKISEILQRLMKK